jgi:hypothetical protein
LNNAITITLQGSFPQCNLRIPRKKDDKYILTCERYSYQMRFNLHITKCKIGYRKVYCTLNIFNTGVFGRWFFDVSKEHGNEVATNSNGVEGNYVINLDDSQLNQGS